MDSRTQSQQKFLIRAGYYGLIAALIGAGLLALRWVGPFVAGLAIAYVLRPQAIRLARRRGAPESRCAAVGLPWTVCSSGIRLCTLRNRRM